jgi:O-methyltransferase
VKTVSYKFVKQALVATGFCITRRQRGAGGVPLDFDNAETKLFDCVRAYTLPSPARIKVLSDAVAHLVTNETPSAITECGVWKGGSMMAAAYTLHELRAANRELTFFDIFEDAMPQAAVVDVTGDGTRLKDKITAKATPYWNFATEIEVKSKMSKTGYPDLLIYFVRGPVEQTLPGSAPTQCALICLDTQLYESPKFELESLYSRLVLDGIVIIEDYGSHSGAKKAVYAFNASLNQRLFLFALTRSDTSRSNEKRESPRAGFVLPYN